MAGAGARRFCDDCRRDVFDLDRLTPGEIRRRIEAGRGQFCGRLTRQAGRLAPLPEAAQPLVALPSPRPRAAAIAAGLVTTWLGAASASARPAEPAATMILRPAGDDALERAVAPRPAAAPGATLSGRVRDENGDALPGAHVVARNALDGVERTDVSGAGGDFEFVDLPAGTYELVAMLEAFSPEILGPIALEPGETRVVDIDLALDETQMVTVGALAVAPQPLRHLFDESDLVAVAVVGDSRIVDAGDPLTIGTEVEIESVLKGPATVRRVDFRPAEFDGEETAEDWRTEFEPGTRILAFLKSSDEIRDGRPAFEDADNGFGVKRLGAAELAAYRDRIADLRRLERRAVRPGELELADLAEWLVATAEEPLTRGEAIGELFWAVTALQEYAAENGTTLEGAADRLTGLLGQLTRAGGRPDDEASQELLGASIVESHRERLDAALAATESLSDGDLQLYQTVRFWDEAGARSWLVERLQGPDAETAGEEQMWLLLGFVMEIEGENSEFVRTGFERGFDIENHWPEGESEATDSLRRDAYLELGRQVRDRLAALLESSP